MSEHLFSNSQLDAPLSTSSFDLGESAGGDVVYEAAHVVFLRNEGAGLDAPDRLADVFFEVVEGFGGPLGLDARLLLDLAAEVVVAEGEHAAVRVVDEDDLFGSEQPL